MAAKTENPSAGASKPRDCLYVERDDESWSHSLFCPVHLARGAAVFGDEGWPTGGDCDRLLYATGRIGLDPASPDWTREA